MRSLVLLLVLGSLAAQDTRRHPADSADRGLPKEPAAFLPYHAEPQHALNRIFRAAWLAECAPAEVAAILPREAPGTGAVFAPGWVHGKRAGAPADLRWFGGDGRQLPVEELSAAAATDLREALDGIGPDQRRLLLEPPELAVLFQHDLLRLAQRLLDAEANRDLVPALQRAARVVALDADERTRLRDPLALAMQHEAMRKAIGAELPQALGGTSNLAFREVLRRSTRLFDAEKTLLWSRVFLAHPDGEAALRAMLPDPAAAETKAKAPTVPTGFRAVLVQGIVALGADGSPYATPVVVDVRTQVLQNRAPLGRDNATFTHDGIDFTILQLERQGIRHGDPERWFRRIDADDQDLFRDYGTRKHTTYRGQCSLCHRTSDTPEPELGGFPVLRPHAKATFATTGDERLRLAEQQARKLLAAIAEAR